MARHIDSTGWTARVPGARFGTYITPIANESSVRTRARRSLLIACTRIKRFELTNPGVLKQQ